jgi:hypothetical protein
MFKRLFPLLLALALVTTASAQGSRRSPHETVSQKLDGNRLTIVYGRPYTKDPANGNPRTVWGGDLVKPGKIWRLGADEATTLIAQKAIKLGGTEIPAGAYSLFFYLADDGTTGTLIVNREIGQWGIDPYHKDQELARIPMERQPAKEPVHQFTIQLDKDAPAKTGHIRLIWEDTQYVVSYTTAG